MARAAPARWSWKYVASGSLIEIVPIYIGSRGLDSIFAVVQADRFVAHQNLPNARPAGRTLLCGFWFETSGLAVPLRSSGKGSLAAFRR
jgi:hypothetical protein